MKLLSGLALSLGLLTEQTEAKGKTPYRRRLQKTFDLVSEWGNANLANHPHNTALTKGDNLDQTKFEFKFNRIIDNIYNMYEDRMVEIAQSCPDTSTCSAYLDCTGEGDRMNTVRGRPAVELSDAYLEFIKDKWSRSRDRIFTEACGFKQKKVNTLSGKFLDMIDAFQLWRLQCRRFSASDCPAHCQTTEKNSGTACVPKE